MRIDFWAQLIRQGMMMGLMPHEFWQLSVREWVMLTGGNIPTLGRNELENLIKEFDK